MNRPTKFFNQITLIIAALLASRTALAISDNWKNYESFVKSIASNNYVQEAWPDHLTQFQETNPQNLGSFPKFWPDYCPPVPEPKEHGTNVHNLLPSDIKLVAGIGDSLTAGNGALAYTAFGLLTEYRGRSFSMGGDGEGRGWENDDVVTFPNLLRHFSDHLTGDSIYKGKHDSKYARFNHAIPGSTAPDMKAQAETLIEHMKSSPDLDFYNDLNKGFMCPLILHFLCRYPGKDGYSDEIRVVRDGYLAAVQSLANSGRYDTRDDFVVVDQPFLRNSSYPVLADGKPDYAFFAPDCFHLSAKGHATAGTSLWNNMMQPEGKKQTSWAVGQPPECIDPNNPFLKTKVNSPKSYFKKTSWSSNSKLNQKKP